MTHAVLERPDGGQVVWDSRRHRKRLGLRAVTRSAGRRERSRPRRATATSLWLAGLFAVGALCFSLGTLPSYVDALAPSTVAATFFVGSLFFTSASYLQFHETLGAPGDPAAGARRPHPQRALLGWAPARIDWWATVIQLAGTLLFNLSTFAATRTDLTTLQDRRLIWAPDLAGSVCFLIASWLAYAEVNQRLVPRPDGSVGWRIATLNLAGSIVFGIAAVAARYLPTGEVANLPLVNLGTFLGAVCFCVGALLLPLESARDRSPA